MKIKYSDVIKIETNDIKEIKKILNLSYRNCKKYGDSFCEVGKVSISFGKNEFEDKVEITSYINIKNGGAYLRKDRSKKELLEIIKIENNL